MQLLQHFGSFTLLQQDMEEQVGGSGFGLTYFVCPDRQAGKQAQKNNSAQVVP
jgi:hypothetical protein